MRLQQKDTQAAKIDKVIQLYDEKIALYERMLKEKDAVMEKLEKLLESK